MTKNQNHKQQTNLTVATSFKLPAAQVPTLPALLSNSQLALHSSEPRAAFSYDDNRVNLVLSCLQRISDDKLNSGNREIRQQNAAMADFMVCFFTGKRHPMMDYEFKPQSRPPESNRTVNFRGLCGGAVGALSKNHKIGIRNASAKVATIVKEVNGPNFTDTAIVKYHYGENLSNEAVAIKNDFIKAMDGKSYDEILTTFRSIAFEAAYN